jgi:hypothetical protein
MHIESVAIRLHELLGYYLENQCELAVKKSDRRKVGVGRREINRRKEMFSIISNISYLLRANEREGLKGADSSHKFRLSFILMF